MDGASSTTTTSPTTSFQSSSSLDTKAQTAPAVKMKATSPPGQRTGMGGGLGGRRKLRSVTTNSRNVTSTEGNTDMHRDLEADELHAMEMQVELQQQALRKKKARFKRRQQQQMHKRADELQNRLKALEAAEKQERRVRLNMRTKLTSLREHDAEDNEEEKTIESNLWEFERDAQIEELTRMKMQIQQLHMQREKMEQRMDSNTVQVTAIEDVLLSRGDQDLKKLQSILDKADALKDSMIKGEFNRENLFKEQDRRDFSTRVIEETKGDGDNNSFKLSDEVEMRRRKEREQKKNQRSEKLRLLNEQRRAINEAQMASVRKEKDHRLLMERGLELLVDIELGVAPPLKYILENARDGDEEIVVESDIESDEERETFISTVQHEMTLIPNVINALEKEKIELQKEKGKHFQTKIDRPATTTQPDFVHSFILSFFHSFILSFFFFFFSAWAQSETSNIKPYNGEMGARSYHPDQLPTFRICISIVEDLAESVTQMLVNRPTEKDVEKELEKFLYMKKQRIVMHEKNRLDRAIRLLNNETISELVRGLWAGWCGGCRGCRRCRRCRG
jgi:hypothetical protein